MEIFNNKKISIAIPSFNSSLFIEECIKGFANSKFIDEYIIQDDCSNAENSENLKNIVRKLENDLNINLYENKKNLGAFKNKFLNIKNCKNDLVYQIDSDNICASNIDNVLKKIDINDKNIYYPSKIYQFRKYPKCAMMTSFLNKKYKVTFTKNDFVFNSSNIKKAIRGENNYTVDKNINWVLNSGNFIVNKNKYLDVFSPLITENKRYPLDAVAISFYWIKSGYHIKTLKSLKHFHRKRMDSVSFVENEGSFESLEYFREEFLKL